MNEIVRRVGPERIVTISQDRYYRNLEHLNDPQRNRNNFDHPNAIEQELLVEHLQLLKLGRPATLPVYDFTRHIRLKETE